MTNYKGDLDSHLSEANSAIANLAADFGVVSNTLRPSHIRRVLNNLSKLLGRLDKGGARFPEFLVDQNGSLPEQVIAEVSQLKDATSSGAENFIKSYVPTLTYLQNQLEKALGASPRVIREVKSQHVRELQSILQDSQRSLEQLRSIRATSEAQQTIIDRFSKSTEDASKKVLDSTQAIAKTRQLAEKLASGDARGSDSLEKLVRLARGKFNEVEAFRLSSESSQAIVDEAASQITIKGFAAEEALVRLEVIEERANNILRGATQAGLAGAYKLERDRLANEQKSYAFVFYGGVFAILVYAVVFLLPIFSAIIESEDNAQLKVGESALLLIARLFILAPVVWALIFTNRRYSKLETLQMDYAAKAATALAYSGYKDEMMGDNDLSTKLKDGLLVRFLEHPERLLNKNAISESVALSPDGGVSYNSSSEVPSSESPKNEA